MQLRTRVNGFTFHYVSIKSLTASHDQYVCVDLHSTMYLLNPNAFCMYSIFPSRFTFHYVSIKSELVRHQMSGLIKFTFHYVSIKSGKTVINITVNVTFTFHYVSIKPVTCCRISKTCIIIYIPLCIY